jgi:hypothetical protein
MVASTCVFDCRWIIGSHQLRNRLENAIEHLLFIGRPVLDFLLKNPNEFLAGNCYVRRQSDMIWDDLGYSAPARFLPVQSQK